MLEVLVLSSEFKNAADPEKTLAKPGQLMKIPDTQTEYFAVNRSLDDILRRLLGYKTFVFEHPFGTDKKIKRGFFSVFLNGIMTEVSLVNKIK